MQDVLHVPQLCNGLLSLTRVSTEQGFDTLISSNFMIFMNEYIYIEINIINKLYFTSIDQYNIITHIITLK